MTLHTLLAQLGCLGWHDGPQLACQVPGLVSRAWLRLIFLLGLPSVGRQIASKHAVPQRCWPPKMYTPSQLPSNPNTHERAYIFIPRALHICREPFAQGKGCAGRAVRRVPLRGYVAT